MNTLLCLSIIQLLSSLNLGLNLIYLLKKKKKKINKKVLLKEVDLFANHWKIQVNGLTLMRQIGPNFSKVG